MNAPSPAQSLLDHLSTLPFVTADVPAISGELKQTPEDFVVEEIPAYLPSGSGEHLYLWIEKRGLNTPDAVRALAQKADAPFESAGWAGLKDRRAVTRQWICLHTPRTPSADELSVEGVRVLQVSRHGNKLRTGHLHGNRFDLLLADVPPEHDPHAQRVLSLLHERGLPNYFGSQRFGFEGKNVTQAYDWIVSGGRAPQKPFLRKLFVSALQSALFNAWLGQRVERQVYGSALRGDILRKEETGGLFVCEDPVVDAARVTSWEISPTGPMFGARMKFPTADALAFEADVLARWGVTLEHFARVEKFGEGTRRPARVRPENVKLERKGQDLRLGFDLPKGAYATGLVSELTKTRQLTLGDEA